MILLRCPKFLRCLTADAGNFDRGHSLTSLPLPLAALGSLPTTSLRTGLGMTREFLRLLSLVVAIRTPVPRPPCLKGGCRPGDSAGRRTPWAGASLLSYLSYPIFRKKQGFPCEFFVIHATSAFFLLPNAPTCSKITLLTVLRVKLRSRSCAMDAHESCQAGNRAALRGIIHVPQGRRLCGFMGRTIYFRKNPKGIFKKRFTARCAHNFCAKRKNSTPAG